MSERKRQDLPSSEGPSEGTGVLWVVATPIGNLGDLTPRAKSVLAAADRILCEDTRNTQKLLHAIGSPRDGRDFERLDAHSSPSKRAQVIERLQQGARMALVSDAGTPGISDPGAELVKEARQAGIRVEPIAGASALAVFLSASGFSGTSFTFRGFFPRKSAERRAEVQLASQGGVGGAWIWFESPQRVVEALSDIAQVLPDARVVCAKELSKIHERFFDGSAREISERVADEIQSVGPKGEWIFAVELSALSDSIQNETSEWVKALQCLIDARITATEAARRVSQVFGAPRNEVYRRALELSGKKTTSGT